MSEAKNLFLTIGRNLIRGFIMMAITIVLVFFSSGQISGISKSIIENKKASLILQKRSEIVSALRSDFKLVGDKEDEIEDAMLPEDDIMEFVAVLESLANQNSLQQSLRFGTPVPVPNMAGFASIDFSLSINGNIFTFLNYIKGFEKLPYAAGISAIGFQALTDKGWENNSSISIQGKLYVRQYSF